MKKHSFSVLCIFPIFLSLTGCNEKCRDDKAAEATIFSYSKERYKKDHWILSSFGTSCHNGIKKLYAIYDVRNKKMNLDEIRNALVTSVESFLDKINDDLKLRPYLNHYPFTHSDIQFSLSFLDRKGMCVEDPEIGLVVLIKDKIVYAVQDHETGLLKDVCEEPYTEAYKIVTGKDYPDSQAGN